jgi:hypothetical protein
VILDASERRGMSHLAVMGQAPHYLQSGGNPAAIQALLTYVARLLHLSPDMSDFPGAIRDFRTACDRAVARNRATREHVRSLEREYDATAGEHQQPMPTEELDSEKLMRDVEEFLRRQREGAGEG